MEKVIYFLCCLMLIASNADGQGIKNSHHDFTGLAWNQDQACSPCHFPKVLGADSLNYPLWNTRKKGNIYISFSSLGNKEHPGQPIGKSKLCLSCHDGTVAEAEHIMYKPKFTLEDLSRNEPRSANEHPVSISYSTFSSFLHDPVKTKSGLGSNIAMDLLENGNVECTSCHDVHLSRNVLGCNGCHKNGLYNRNEIMPMSLWKTNNLSGLCLTCHKS